MERSTTEIKRKWCPHCKTQRHARFFRRRGGNRKDYQSWCNDCQLAYKNEYYKEYDRAYRQKNKDKVNAANRKHYHSKGYRKIIERYKILKDKPCLDCKVRYPYYVMDFDHVRGKKKATVGSLKKANERTLLKEIAKCDLICANCHRKRTYQRKMYGTKYDGN